MITYPTPKLPRVDMIPADAVLQPFEQLFDFKTFASLRRMVSHQQSKPLLRRADFMKQITLYLPEVAARIEESDFGVLHLEVGAMKLATKDAIASRDFASVRKYLMLVAEFFDRADAELYDAIRVSYLEGLFLEENSSSYAEARKLLSRTMENVLRQSELHLERLRNTVV